MYIYIRGTSYDIQGRARRTRDQLMTRHSYSHIDSDHLSLQSYDNHKCKLGRSTHALNEIS